MVTPSQLSQEIIKSKKYLFCVYPFSKITVKLRGLAWSRKSPKFNLHHLRTMCT